MTRSPRPVGVAIGQLTEDDPQVGSREVFGVTPNPFLEGTLDGASPLLDVPPDFDLAHLLPGAVGLSQRTAEALVIQAATPDLPPTTRCCSETKIAPAPGSAPGHVGRVRLSPDG